MTPDGQRQAGSAVPGATFWLAALALFAAFAVVHAHAARSLVGMWDRNPMYSYGYLIVPVSLGMIWTTRGALANVERRPAVGSGAAILLLWLMMFLVGRTGGVILFEQLALLVALVGIVLVVFGRQMVAMVAVPLAYLLLMVPFWDVFTEPLHVPFQNLSANIGVRLLQLIGIPAFRDATYITLPSMQLEVARACSGVNYLVAVMALGLPLAYLYLRTPWRRVALIVSALIVAALSNALRVALIGVLVTTNPDTPLHGPGHVLHGLFVAGIGHVTLFVALWFLMRGERRLPPDTTRRESAALAQRGGLPWQARGSLAAVIVVTALFAATWLFVDRRAAVPVALPAELDQLPRELGTWTTAFFAPPTAPRFWPNADKGLRRQYRRDGLVADVYIGYLSRQQHPREVLTPHAESLHRLARPVTLPQSDGTDVTVNRVSWHDGPDQQMMLFWYDLDGHPVAGATAVKLRTMWNAVVHRRTNGAVVSVSMQIPKDTDSRLAASALEELAIALHRALATHLPGRSGTQASTLVQRGTRAA